MSASKPLLSRRFPPKRIEYKHGDTQLSLRPFEADDAENFQQVLKDSLPWLYKFMLWPVKEWNFEECLLEVVQQHAAYFLGTVFEWGCFDLRTGELLGSVGIMPATPFNPDCWEIGYWISPRHMNKGLATLATQIITMVSFQCLQVKRLQVGSASENPASIRVIEKCGFHYEGKLRGFFPPPSEDKVKKGAVNCKTDFLYALLPEDCQKLPWYDSVEKSTSILPLYGQWLSCSQLGTAAINGLKEPFSN